MNFETFYSPIPYRLGAEMKLWQKTKQNTTLEIKLYFLTVKCLNKKKLNLLGASKIDGENIPKKIP